LGTQGAALEVDGRDAAAARHGVRGAHPQSPAQNRGTGEVLGARAGAGVRAHAVRPRERVPWGVRAARVVCTDARKGKGKQER
jgi:hypothetical protein